MEKERGILWGGKQEKSAMICTCENVTMKPLFNNNFNVNNKGEKA